MPLGGDALRATTLESQLFAVAEGSNGVCEDLQCGTRAQDALISAARSARGPGNYLCSQVSRASVRVWGKPGRHD